MRDLHPEIRKYWESAGEEIVVEDDALRTVYCLKGTNLINVPIAVFSKLKDDIENTDRYWITKDDSEMSCSELVAVRKIKLMAFI